MPGSAERVVLFGDPEGIRQSLSAFPRDVVVAVVGAIIRPMQHPVLRTVAAEYAIPFWIQPRRSSEAELAEFRERVAELRPDLIFVNSYSMLVPQQVLGAARLGGVNVHGGLLPEYRGSNPIQWAILRGESVGGVTMHRMTEQFDSGAIVARRCVPIHFDDTWLEVRDRIREATDAMLRDEVPRLLSGDLRGVPQDERRACHYRRRIPADGEIDWDQSVRFLHDLVRALVAPHPGAFFKKAGERIILDRYHTLAELSALKFGSGGAGRRLVEEDVELVPEPLSTCRETPGGGATRAGDERVDFTVRQVDTQSDIGRASVVAIEPMAGRATLIIVDTRLSLAQAGRAHRLLDSFAGKELGLAQLQFINEKNAAL